MDKYKIFRNALIIDNPILISQSLKSIRNEIANSNEKNHYNKILYKIIDEIVNLVLPHYHGDYEFYMFVVRENSLGKFIATQLTSVFVMFVNYGIKKESVVAFLTDLINFIDGLQTNTKGTQITNAEISFAWDLIKKTGLESDLISKASLSILVSPHSHTEANALYSEYINTIIMFNVKSGSFPIEVLLGKFAEVYINKNDIDVSLDNNFTYLFETIFKRDKSTVDKADWNGIYAELFTLNILYDTPYGQMINPPPILMKNIGSIKNYFNSIHSVI